jgi:hypothetical protein
MGGCPTRQTYERCRTTTRSRGLGRPEDRDNGRISCDVGVLPKRGDVVLDGEVAVITADGRADSDLLAGWVHGPRALSTASP